MMRWVLLIPLLLAGCTTREHIAYRIEHRYDVADEQFRRSMNSLLGPTLLGGNSVTTLNNGDEIFPAMLTAIRGAKETINFETHIYWSGDIADEFNNALIERAKAGVKVYMLIDALGSAGLPTRQQMKRLRRAGAKVEEYHPVAWYNPSTAARVNNRTHRKLLIVDGRIGFTGGVGIADDWAGHAQDKKHWRDMHYRVEGPVVAHLQAAFADNWMKTTGRVLDGEVYFPELPEAGNLQAQVFKSSSSGGSESMELMFLLSLAAARHNVRLGSAYFVPNNRTIDALIDARRRGARVQIIVPGRHMDMKVVKSASRAKWGKLLKAGVEIYEFQPTMYHTKILIVDDRWVSIGSANLDNRSFRLNDEANLNVLDAGFAAEQIRHFEADLARSKPYRYEEWKKRSLWNRLNEWIAAPFIPLL